MANVLFLTHRLPYPPDKGDKVRSYHLLEHLRAKHSVFLGTFVDDPDDEVHVDAVRERCADLQVVRLWPRRARLASLTGLTAGEALTLRYYRSAELRRWIELTQARTRIAAAIVFSSSMAQYAEGLGVPTFVDFVDVDSAKWSEYSGHHRWPMSWLFRREGRQLLNYERRVAANADTSFFVTEKEVALFRRLAPECAHKVEALGNGVDAEHFSPDPSRASPFSADEIPIVFTGAMDYWPNIDAVSWFAQAILPELRRKWPALRFHVVGRNPAAQVRALAGESTVVTGTVADVRPYLQHAAVVVAPLRLARGIQNKVLEAMAMARPTVVAHQCAEAIDAVDGSELVAANDAESFVRAVDALLGNAKFAAAVGAAGRSCVSRAYGWPARLAALDRHLDAVQPSMRGAA